MSISIHLTNSKGRDATVGILPVKSPPAPKLGLPGTDLLFRRYIAAVESGTDASLKSRFGHDYAAELVKEDPEVDLEKVGMIVEQTQTVYLNENGEVMYNDPRFIELILNPDGSEKERRDPVDVVSNVNIEEPIRWTGRKIPIADAVRRFSFRRSVQLQHVDGLTYDYLYQIAKELEDSKSLMLLGTGEKGAGPLVFQANGRPYRGLLSGKTKDKSYKLILHLSDMELKKPATAGGKIANGE